MAQLRDLERAKALVRSATRAFGSKETVSAQGVVAVAEMELVSAPQAAPPEPQATLHVCRSCASSRCALDEIRKFQPCPADRT
jgi:hypothetical protein